MVAFFKIINQLKDVIINLILFNGDITNKIKREKLIQSIKI